MSKPNIISLGEVLWDLFPDGARFGGAPANFACHAAILGAEVTMVSAVGDDERGREATEILSGFGIDTSLLQVAAEAPTGTVGVEVDAAGKPRFTIHEGSGWDRLAWTPDLEARIATSDAVYFGTLGQRSPESRATIRRALEIAQTAGVQRILDVNLRAPFFDEEMIRESVALAGVLKLSDDELAEVTAACGVAGGKSDVDTLRDLLDRSNLECIVMTRGPEGALFISEQGVCDQPGVPADVVDTVGAGDSFTAVFVIGLLKKTPPREILRQACERAAEVCGMPGAVPDRKASRRDAETQSFS